MCTPRAVHQHPLPPAPKNAAWIPVSDWIPDHFLRGGTQYITRCFSSCMGRPKGPSQNLRLQPLVPDIPMGLLSSLLCLGPLSPHQQPHVQKSLCLQPGSLLRTLPIAALQLAQSCSLQPAQGRVLPPETPLFPFPPKHKTPLVNYPR